MLLNISGPSPPRRVNKAEAIAGRTREWLGETHDLGHELIKQAGLIDPLWGPTPWMAQTEFSELVADR